MNRVEASPVVVIFHKKCAEAWADELSRRHAGVEFIPCAEEGALRQSIGRAEVIFTWRDFPVDAFREASRLRWVQVSAAGVETFVRSGVLPDGVELTRVVGSFGPRMAEYVIAHAFAHAQRIPLALRNQKDRRWAPFAPLPVAGKRMAVLGLGAIGGEVARLAGRVGMRVRGLATSRRDVPGVEQVFVPDELPELLAWADVVASVLPLTEKTRRILGPENLTYIRNDAILINVGRGALIDEAALAERLSAGSIGGASLDVFTEEPLSPDSPLWDLPNVVITPHISGVTEHDEALDTFSDNLRRYVAGEPLRLEADVARGY